MPMSKKQKAKVEIYTWSMCPFCHAALDLLNGKGLEFEEICIDGDEAAREEMAKKTKGNRRSVPQVFIDGVSLGGYDDISGLERAGELDSLLYE